VRALLIVIDAVLFEQYPCFVKNGEELPALGPMAHQWRFFGPRYFPVPQVYSRGSITVEAGAMLTQAAHLPSRPDTWD
jgi:hypothetical protein